MLRFVSYYIVFSTDKIISKKVNTYSYEACIS